MMTRMINPGACAVSLAIALAAMLGLSASSKAAEEVSFRLDVQPILESRCVQCHLPGGEGYKASGLDLSTYEGLMKGTKHGPIVVPGEAFVSNFNVLIEGRADPKIRMPHHQRPLLKAQQEILRTWVRQGAKNN